METRAHPSESLPCFSDVLDEVCGRASQPRLVEGALKQTNITQIAVLRSSTFALTDKGTVFSWGGNEHGRLGLGIDEVTTRARACSYYSRAGTEF